MKKAMFWLLVAAVCGGAYIILSGMPTQIRNTGQEVCHSRAVDEPGLDFETCYQPYHDEATAWTVGAGVMLVGGLVGAGVLFRRIYGGNNLI